MQAIENEARRHVEVYENGGTVDQETRRFDPVTGLTQSMRKKSLHMITVIFPNPICRRWS